MRPILFNTEMVQAILDGRKTTTRRLIKPPAEVHICTDGIFVTRPKSYPDEYCRFEPYSPFCKSDVLYVRETWRNDAYVDGRIEYRASPTCEEQVESYDPPVRWHPSLHMPKEAAQIFLRVTDVRVERLQEIDVAGCMHEGVFVKTAWTVNAKPAFIKLWDSTVKKSDLDRYGWDANPFVWVIEFERCKKPLGGETS